MGVSTWYEYGTTILVYRISTVYLSYIYRISNVYLTCLARENQDRYKIKITKKKSIVCIYKKKAVTL